MNRSEQRVGYAIAVVATAITLLIRLALADMLAEQARLMPFILAVIAAAWWAGLGPGILATVLASLLGCSLSSRPPIRCKLRRLRTA